MVICQYPLVMSSVLKYWFPYKLSRHSSISGIGKSSFCVTEFSFLKLKAARCGSGGKGAGGLCQWFWWGTVDDKVGEDDERDARESSPQPGRTGRRETGRKEMGCRETG